MNEFHSRSVFFVSDAEKSLDYYTNTLGFELDWNHQETGKAFVFQVSLFGFQLILNQVQRDTENRAGHGRVFVGVDDEQGNVLQMHIKDKGIETSIIHWGNQTLVIRDPDGNELFFSLPTDQD
jgi:catechol 2,3-dioxygenase-like lactoylglutathione lyase family enzyme